MQPFSQTDRIAGCLLGGALGDALGGPIEFLSLEQIRRQFGPNGIRGFEDYRLAGIPGAGQITDDTQMTLFTAEGLLRAECCAQNLSGADPVTRVHHAYIRWLHTQGGRSKNPDLEKSDDGWLISIPQLHARRAPGNTCLQALMSGEMGTVRRPINNSKGCGGVMRAAPAGMFPLGSDPFELGAQIAAITHGHPSGYLTAGCLAQMVHELMIGVDLVAAVQHAIDRLEKEPESQECQHALRMALRLWEEDPNHGNPEQVERLGEGWVAEEALAIGTYCALEAGGDFKRGICLAINHSGDSDSTGSIAGNLLGTTWGREALPAAWLEKLELKDVIDQIATDLAERYRESQEWQEKYPG